MFESKTTRDIGAVLLVTGSLVGLAGCSPSGRLKYSAPATTTDLGESVYQLPAGEWPRNLVKFKEDHPELRIVDTEVATSSNHGDPTSFIVITEPLDTKSQSASAEVGLKDFSLPSSGRRRAP